MWRIKTDDELRMDGWKIVGGGFYSPDGTMSFTRDMRQLSETMPQDIIHAIVENKATRYLRFNWHPSMFTFAPVQNIMCQCAWNKHPLYCSCPGKTALDNQKIDDIVASLASSLPEEDDEEEDDDHYDEDDYDYEDEEEEDDYDDQRDDDL